MKFLGQAMRGGSWARLISPANLCFRKKSDFIQELQMLLCQIVVAAPATTACILTYLINEPSLHMHQTTVIIPVYDA